MSAGAGSLTPRQAWQERISELLAGQEDSAESDTGQIQAEQAACGICRWGQINKVKGNKIAHIPNASSCLARQPDGKLGRPQRFGPRVMGAVSMGTDIKNFGRGKRGRNGGEITIESDSGITQLWDEVFYVFATQP